MKDFGVSTGVLAVAYLVLVAGLAATTGQAGQTASTIKRLFGLRNSEYQRVAEDISKKMKMNDREFPDIHSAAWNLNLNSDYKNSLEYIGLAKAIGSLRGQTDEFRLICDKPNLAKMRLLAEAIKRHANFGPEQMTKPMKRVTTTLVNEIAEAWSQCPGFLERGRPFPLEFRLSSPEHERQVANLALVPKSFLYDNQMDSEFYEKLTAIIQLNEGQEASRLIGAGAKPDKSVLVKLIKKYIHEPCEELIKIEAHQPLLRPFFDLLISNHLISPVSLAKFYENENTVPGEKPAPKYHEDTQHWAELYEACARLTAISSKKLAKAIIKARD